MRRLILIGAAGLMLAGCGNPLGKSDFDCPAPSGVTCMSARQVYEATNYTDSISAKPKASEKASRPAADPIEPTPVTADFGRMPILTPSRVMRVWVAPWESSDGDLVVGGLLYTVITPRRWQIGQPAPSNDGVIEPLAAQTASERQAATVDPLAPQGGGGQRQLAPSPSPMPGGRPGPQAQGVVSQAGAGNGH